VSPRSLSLSGDALRLRRQAPRLGHHFSADFLIGSSVKEACAISDLSAKSSATEWQAALELILCEARYGTPLSRPSHHQEASEAWRPRL
jgi:hypothetical protein